MSTIQETIIQRYWVKVTKKDNAIPRKSLCGQPLNEDGVSFNIPAGFLDYYKTQLAGSYTFGEPFLKEEPECNKLNPPIREFVQTNVQINEEKSEAPINRPETPIGYPVYACKCGYKNDNFNWFMRHAEKCHRENKKKQKETKAGDTEYLGKPYRKPQSFAESGAESNAESGYEIKHLKREYNVDSPAGNPGEVGEIQQAIDEADNYVPSMNAQSVK